MFEVDASLNSNTLMGTKTVTQKIKVNNMNKDDHDDATNRPVSPINEATPNDDVFPGATAASTIVPDAHILPSGQKQLTKPFFQWKWRVWPIRTKSTPSLQPISMLLPPTPPPNPLAWQSLTPHIHWEIAISPPAPSAPKISKKAKQTSYDQVSLY